MSLKIENETKEENERERANSVHYNIKCVAAMKFNSFVYTDSIQPMRCIAFRMREKMVSVIVAD